MVVAEGALFIEAAPAPEEDYLSGLFFVYETISKHISHSSIMGLFFVWLFDDFKPGKC